MNGSLLYHHSWCENISPIKPVAACCREKKGGQVRQQMFSLLCFSCMLRLSVEQKISDVDTAGVWWFQFDDATGRQPTGK